MSKVSMLQPLIANVAKQEHHLQLACQSCALYGLCLPLGLHRDDLTTLDRLIKRSSNVTRHYKLFEVSTPFKMIYVVRSGAFKTTISADDGREQVTGFYLPGEIIGLDAIYPQYYQSTARALVTSSVCALPYESFQSLSMEIPQLQLQMLSRLSKELSDNKQLLFSLGQKTAEEKLITFLLSMSRRYSERGYSASSFALPMSRNDIANHLGLAIETVSRLFSRLAEQNIIKTEAKSVMILDQAALVKGCG